MFDLWKRKFVYLEFNNYVKASFHSIDKRGEIFYSPFDSTGGHTQKAHFEFDKKLDLNWFASSGDCLLVNKIKPDARDDLPEMLNIIRIKNKEVPSMLFLEDMEDIEPGTYVIKGGIPYLVSKRTSCSQPWRYNSAHSLGMIVDPLLRNERAYNGTVVNHSPIHYMDHHFEFLKTKAEAEVPDKMVIPEIMLVGVEENGNFFGMYKDHYTIGGTFKKIQHIVEDDKNSKIVDSVVEVPKGWIGINEGDIFYSPGFSWIDPGEDAHIILFVYPIDGNPRILIIDSLYGDIGKEFQEYKGFYCMVNGQVLKLDTPEFLNIKEIDIGIKQDTGDIVKYCSDREYRYSNDRLFLRRMLDVYNKLFPNIAKEFKYG